MSIGEEYKIDKIGVSHGTFIDRKRETMTKSETPVKALGE